MTAPIRVGVIGCGEISQVMHLPNIAAMPEFELVAACDISQRNLDHVAARFQPQHTYLDYRDLLADDAVDAVIVATYEHFEITVAAAAAGKHLLVEKPLAFTPAQADRIVAAVEDAGVVGLVGYMKVYDEAFERFCAVADQIDRARAAQVHNLAGRFDRHHGLFDVSRGTDIDPAVLAATSAQIESDIRDALGPQAADRHGLLHNLVMLGSHDLAVLRGAFGAVTEVLFAHGDRDDSVRAAVLTQRGILCDLTVGIGTTYPWWDEWASIHGDDRVARIEFPNPYLPHERGVVSQWSDVRGGASESITIGTYESAFHRELAHWARCIAGEESPRTPVSMGAADLHLAYDIVRLAAAGGRP